VRNTGTGLPSASAGSGGSWVLSWRASDRGRLQRFAYYSVLALPVLISAVAIRSVPLFGERAEAKGKPIWRETLRPVE